MDPTTILKHLYKDFARMDLVWLWILYIYLYVIRNGCAVQIVDVQTFNNKSADMISEKVSKKIYTETHKYTDSNNNNDITNN